MTTYRLWALADERGRLYPMPDNSPLLCRDKPDVYVQGFSFKCNKLLKTPRTYKPVRVRVTVEVEG